MKGLRDYHEEWRRLGIQNPGDVRYGPEIQFVAQVDELQHLIPPVQVPVVGVGAFTPAAAGTHAGLQIEARGRGCWIEWVSERAGATAHALITATPAAAVAGVGPPYSCNSGPAALSIASQIRIATPLPTNTMVLNSQDEFPTAFFIEPGQAFQIVHNTANTNGNYTVIFREVPARGPDPVP